MRTMVLALLAIAPAFAAEPEQMWAVVQTGIGGPEVLQLRQVPVLAPGRGQVLIKIYAAAVNALDWKDRVGYAPPPASAPDVAAGAAAVSAAAPELAPARPFIERVPGNDIAGVIEKVGEGVDASLVGAEVFARLTRSGVAGLNGGYAEYAIANLTSVAAMPRKLSFAQAAGLGTAGLTGMRAIVQADVRKRQRVLILGIAGGVGSSAAQAAKARGAYVIGTASARHNEYLRSIGVDEVIDYTKLKFETQVRDIDVVLDTVGGTDTTRAIKTMRKGGMLISWVWFADPAACKAAEVRCPSGRGNGPGGAATFTEAELLGQVAALADEGKFTVNIDQSFALVAAGEAQEWMRAGHTEGKVIILVDPAAAARHAMSEAERRDAARAVACTVCPAMVSIPAGTFRMGGLVKVAIPMPLAIGKTEITFAQWDACVAEGGCQYVPEDSGWGRGDRPVMGVSWDDIQQYLRWLSRKTGDDYRLLSESEWEYAARAGSSSAFFWGDDEAEICRYASVDHGGDACGKVRPAGAGGAAPNAWGLQDMSGSMWEWVQDCWTENLRKLPRDGAAFAGGGCQQRALRGGAWNFTADYARSDSRSFSAPSIRYDSYGFRVAKTD